MTEAEKASAYDFNPKSYPAPEPLDKLAPALAKAQGEMSNAHLNKVNPHFKSKFADLASIRDATIPALAKNGLSIVQFTKMHGEALILHTRLLHTSGQYIEGEYPMPVAIDKPQVMGSAFTYAKRYSWSAICGIAADEDDDANAASPSKKANGKTAEPKWKTTAERIKAGIDAHATVKDLDAFFRQESKNFTAIKKESASAYEFLMGRVTTKREELAQGEAE
jgi:hypothetical protein